MTTLQRRAFAAAARASLDPRSVFYPEDLRRLKEHYESKSDAECRESLSRLVHRPSEGDVRDATSGIDSLLRRRL